MKLILILSIFLIITGIIEKIIYIRKRDKIPLKIYVNGTRGKSSTTRLIAGALRKAGFKVIAKTTGSAARFILEDGQEEEIKRNGIARIKEQMKGCLLAAINKADVLVMECMAISPEMQWVSENEMLDSDIGVITNVYYDHLDKMGHNLEEIAEVLALTIPQNAQLVTGEDKYFSLFEDIALKNNTKIYQTNPSIVSDAEIEEFNYPVFKENIACALKICSLLDVNKDIALQGMKEAKPDIGALKILFLKYKGRTIYLINAFAANDYTSSLKAWDKCKKWYHKTDIFDLPLIGVFNHRPDRGYRLNDIAHLTPEIGFEELFIIGAMAACLVERKVKKINARTDVKKYSLKVSSIDILLDDIIKSRKDDILLFGFGNIKGSGEKILKYFEENGEQYGNS